MDPLDLEPDLLALSLQVVALILCLAEFRAEPLDLVLCFVERCLFFGAYLSKDYLKLDGEGLVTRLQLLPELLEMGIWHQCPRQGRRRRLEPQPRCFPHRCFQRRVVPPGMILA